MKRMLAFWLLFLLTASSYSQSEYAGIWQGNLKISAFELRIVFRITEENDSLNALMDSPDQGAKDIPVSSVIATDSTIRLNVNSVNGYYEGELLRDSMMLTGKWNQGGMSLPLDMKKVEKLEEVKRPQLPQKPYPYNEEEVFFDNKDAEIKLAGTFTYPKEGKDFPAVILVTGSGMQDRDASLLGHKSFLVLSDYLTRQGIAVLRYDDRGGGKSTGNYLTATSMDFLTDALAAVEYLKSRKEVANNKIGIAGHSEGGLIAPLAANRSDDVAFIVLMAGPGTRGDRILMAQSALISRTEGTPEEEIERINKVNKEIYDLILTETDTTVMRNKILEILKKEYGRMPADNKEINEKVIQQHLNQITSPWFLNFVKYDPYPELKKVDIPLLAVNGEYDLQVPAKENLTAIEKAMKEGGNKNYTVMELKGLNHLFQKSETGKVTEYGKLEETFSPEAMKIIADWILETTNGL